MSIPSSATCNLAVRCAVADSPAPDPRQTKVLLPDKKPQKWSTGMAPGEYGGPPTTSKLRKYYGGGGDEDPVTSTDDFIWNKDFVPKMKRIIGRGGEGSNAAVSLKKQSDSGFLSLNRAMNLDSVEVDLSTELASPPKPILEQQVEAARRGRYLAAESLSKATSPRWRLAPTMREQARWDRANKVATGGSDVIIRESKRAPGDPRVAAALAREQYLKLKENLQLLTLGIGGVGVVCAYVSYSTETTLSFGAGLLGSIVYLRMLGNSVEAVAGGARGVVKSAAAQPRLLVPVALVMVFNRWNEILVPQYGFMHLELIPMLVGFFTYKIATFAQTIQETFFVVEQDTKR